MSTLFPVPEWARTTSIISDPDSDEQDAGWAEGEVPPARFMNWLQRYAGQWLRNLSGAAPSYASLDEFIEKAEAGDQGLVRQYAGDRQPLEEITVSAVTGDLVSVHGDGEKLVLATSTTVALYSKDGVLELLYAPTNAPTNIWRAMSNGTFVVVAYDQYVEVFSRDGGGSQWIVDHGATLTDVAIDHDQVYITGAAGTGGFHARALELTGGGATVWDFNHGATLNAVCTDGVRCYVGGNAGTGGEHVVALDRGAGTSIWTLTDTIVANGQSMCCDGEELWVKANTKLHLTSPKFGGIIEEAAVGAGDTSFIWLTPRYLFLRLASALSYIDRKHGASTVPGASVIALTPAISHGAAPTSVYSDGDNIVLGGPAGTGGNQFRVHRMPQLRDRWYRRTASTDAFQPLRGLAHPVE